MKLPALANSATTPKVSIHNGKAVTTSLDVADYFRKLHKDVLKKIDSLDCSPEFTSANFCADVQSIEIGNGATRDSKIYEMTKDGFVFLVMGFTGKKAAAFKEAYIAEFNRMEAQAYQSGVDADIFLSIRNGQVILLQQAQEGQFFASVDTFLELSRKRGYLVIHKDDLIKKLST